MRRTATVLNGRRQRMRSTTLNVISCAAGQVLDLYSAQWPLRTKGFGFACGRLSTSSARGPFRTAGHENAYLDWHSWDDLSFEKALRRDDERRTPL